jgi:DNA polymerase I-like protein with 3'-5' exonuclease and polymerase domains
MIDTIKGPFSRIEFQPINLNSDVQVKEYLLSKGWRPTTWNYKKDKRGKFIYGNDGKKIKTSPQLTEDSFKSVKGNVPEKIARRNILSHRKSLLYNEKEGTGLISFIRSDGRIAAEGIPLATPTARYRHKQIVNIPSEDTVLGSEIRSCFIARNGYYLIGTDAKGLEARMEAHYCYPYTGGAEYARELLDGDPHEKNMQIFNCSRRLAKNGKYALLYGCSPPKLAETIGCSPKKAKQYWNDYWDQNIPLKELKVESEKEWRANKGWVRGIDGRKLFVRYPHTIINTLFQSAGSITVKKATVLLFNEWLPKTEIDAKLVIHQHDEHQAEIAEKDIVTYCYLSEKSFEEAGRYYKLNIPIEGECKIGKDWSETH